MTQEEKAQAYDEALERAREWSETKNGLYMPKELCEEIFPELKESEDERIRKNLIGYIKGVNEREVCKETLNEWVAWLEKQGEQNLVLSEEDNNMLKWVIAYLNNRMLNTPISEERTACKNAIAWLEKLKDEKKSADKVEPKFNVGDKIQFSKGCGTIMTIEKIENGEYVFANNMGHTTIEWGNKWYLV